MEKKVKRKSETSKVSWYSRLRWLTVKDFFPCIYLIFKALWMSRHKDKIPFEERYAFAQKWIHKYHKDFKLDIEVTGLENIPKDEGIFFVGNHQGKNDCLLTLHALRDFPASWLITKERSGGPIMGPMCKAFDAKLLDTHDLRAQVELYKEMGEDLKAGKRFVIFPEAEYDDNHNTMSEFHSACFDPALRSQCTIVPFCLYDSWRVFEDPSKKTVHVGVHFLQPIRAEEYKGLNRKALSALTQSRIQEKLDELTSDKNQK
jgi:1-acyl-sn-glycerol-3-phosphate acyltransferase